jgi:hypothetical protein
MTELVSDCCFNELVVAGSLNWWLLVIGVAGSLRSVIAKRQRSSALT